MCVDSQVGVCVDSGWVYVDRQLGIFGGLCVSR